MKKIYCFVDETGQDTLGKFFLVIVVALDSEILEVTEKQLLKIEISSKKGLRKWKLISNDKREKYLNGILGLKNLRGSIYYSVFHESKEYSSLTSLAIAKVAVLYKESLLRIIIDGLNAKEKENTSHQLKKLGIKYDKIRGMKDEQNVFLRLADIMAGLTRDYVETGKFIKLYKELLKEDILQEI